MLNRMYSINSVLEKGLQASVIKNNIIQDNIANADTPDYQRKSVIFESKLAKEMEASKKSGVIDVRKIVPTVESSPPRYRLDGNGVDINTEMVELYKNAVRYDMLISSVSNNIKKINLVLNK